MLFNVFPVILIFASIAVIIIVVLRRLPEITAINTDTIPEAKVAEVKRQLLIRRLERKMRLGIMAAWSSTAGLRAATKEKASALYQKLSKLEDHYRASSLKNDHVVNATGASAADQASQLVIDADSKKQEGLWSEAESLYLEAIKQDHRQVNAYLGLGMVYRAQRQYKEAIEALAYARQLKDDASTAAALGEVCIEAGRLSEALSPLKACVKAEPMNEHYLDRLLEAAILLRKKKLASGTLAVLSEKNPQYPKLVEFKQRINAMPSTMRRNKIQGE